MTSAEMSILFWTKFVLRIKTLVFLLVISSHGVCCWQNFALNKFANQSSTILYNGFQWTADKAVDGNNNGSNPENSSTCSATNVTLGNHTWEVDIGFQIMVKNITVYGRTDGVDQLSGFHIFVGNNSSPWRFNPPLVTPQSSNYTHVFTAINFLARFVSVVRSNQSILTLCEVTVEGECLDGVYSEFCNLTCGRCNQSRPCDKDTGVCLHGCDRGWKETRCDTDCEKGTYDSGCQETCGRCLNGNNSCSTIDGHCINGCQEGWQGENCKIGCEKGRYGPGCMETCGDCLNDNNSCSTTDGHCTDGCQSGWRGDTCKIGCEHGTYGPGCQEKCGSCINGSNSCSTKNGKCVNGCLSGWQGDTCKIGSPEDKNPTSSGVNVPAIGGAVGGVIVVGIIIIVVTITIVKRRRRDKTDKSIQIKNVGTRNQDHEKSESYCNIANYSSAGKASYSKTRNNTEQESTTNDDYEKLQNSAQIDGSVYSVIDDNAGEGHKRETIELKAGSSVEYAQQLLTLETELRAMVEKKEDIIMKKKKLLEMLAKSEATEQ